MADKARFWNKITEKYAATPVKDQASYERKLQMTQSRLTPEMTVLEYGCGTGSTALAHAPFVARIDASDVSDVMIRIAQEKAAAAGVTNVRFEVADIETLTGEPPYDAALALSILHLVPDADAAMAKTAALLKPGGLFISSTFCLADQVPWLRFIAPVMRLIGKFPETLTFFKFDDLEARIRAAGFDIEEVWRPGRMKADFIIARKR